MSSKRCENLRARDGGRSPRARDAGGPLGLKAAKWPRAEMREGI